MAHTLDLMLHNRKYKKNLIRVIVESVVKFDYQREGGQLVN